MPDTQQIVSITPLAAEEVKKLIDKENKPGIGLRLGVKGGGCSGLSYDLGFTPAEKGDTVVEHEGFLNFGESIVAPGKDRIGQAVTVHISENEIQAPVFRRREISNTVRIPDGSWVLQGGIQKTDKQQVQDKIPLLGDLPLIGKLATTDYEVQSTRYLYVLMQVRVINPSGQPVAAVQF